MVLDVLKEPVKQLNKQSTPLDFNLFIGYLKSHFSLLPDKRQGNNCVYRISDAALSAFSVFFTQSSSFLSHQQHMQETKGKNNAGSLFQVDNIPSDNHIRNLLDPISPSYLVEIFELGFEYFIRKRQTNPIYTTQLT